MSTISQSESAVSSQTSSRLSMQTPGNLDTLLNIAKVLLASVANLDEDEQDTLKETLQIKLEQFQLPVEIIATSLDICTVITRKRNETLKVSYFYLKGKDFSSYPYTKVTGCLSVCFSVSVPKDLANR